MRVHSVIRVYVADIRLVNCSGLVPTPWAGVYAASKAAIGSWSETLRMECKGLGVNVMLVCPGAITSGFGIKQESSIKVRLTLVSHSVCSLRTSDVDETRLALPEREAQNRRTSATLPTTRSLAPLGHSRTGYRRTSSPTDSGVLLHGWWKGVVVLALGETAATACLVVAEEIYRL